MLLEPVMKLNVSVPTESSGSVFAYLTARRGEIDRQESDGRVSEIEARVPLVKMFDYADELRSLTQGRASSTMAPHAYAPAPDEVLRTFLEG
jgi:elongation factor G